jgi:hypothetical protein
VIVYVDTSTSRFQRVTAPALVGAAGAGAFALLHVRDPHESGSYGFCPFLLVTGRPCPGCGGLRAMNDLSHGDLTAALSSNLIAVLLVAGLAVAWLVWMVRSLRGLDGPAIVLQTRSQIAVLVVFVVFGIVRNTPWGSWLAP